jgi:hypothetical protein
MKIKVADLKPNPFRNIKNYPINREKVEALKNSINETTFWDNIMARKSGGGKFEIAYGHHRLEALKELGIKEIDIPVRDLDDATMLKMMADENMDVWRQNTVVINETVLAAKLFLEKEIAKYDNWEAFRSGGFSRPIFDSEPQFRSVKGKGKVGREIIMRFLGDNWTEETVKRALAILNDEMVHREASECFDHPYHANVFREICGNRTERISNIQMLTGTIPDPIFKTKEDQVNIAKTIKQRLTRRGEITKDAIKTEFTREVAKIRDGSDEELITEMTDEDYVREMLEGKIDDLQAILRGFVRRIKKLKKDMVEVGKMKDLDKKAIIKKSSFYPLVDLLEETLEEGGLSLTKLLEEREEKA